MIEGILANPVLSDSDRERDTLFMQYIQNLYGYDPNYLSTIPSYVEAEQRLASASAAGLKPQGIETIAGLASRYGLSPDIVAQFSQKNKPRLGNDADPEPRPTLYGYSGNLSGLTGRYLSQADLGLESGRGRPETYADVLARARTAEQERGRD